MDKLKLVSWNTRGLGDTNGRGKRRSLKSWIHEWNRYCIMLQEAKLNEDKIRDLGPWWDGPQIWSPAQGTRGGVCILLHRDLQVRVIDKEAEIWGRWAWMRVEVGSDEWLLMTVYAPTKTREREAFFRSLISNIPRVEKVILAGDWNRSLDDALRPDSGCAGQGDVVALLQLIETVSLTDPFRLLNPDNPGFTWFSHLHHNRQRMTRRRLDYVLVTDNLMSRVLTFKQTCNPLSDHKPVTAEVRLQEGGERGKGFFRLNKQVLENPGVRDWVEDHLVKWDFARPFFGDTAEWLDAGLAILSGVLDVWSRVLAKCRNVKEAECRKRVEEAEERMEGHPISAMVWVAERAKRMEEWDTLQQDKQRRWAEMLREKRIETHDLMTKETFQKLQPRRVAQQTVELRHPFDSNAPNTETATGMLHYAKLYYEDISPQGKSPGIDGLTVEFYNTFWNSMDPKLVDVYNQILVNGCLGKGMIHGVISMLFKKGDKSQAGASPTRISRGGSRRVLDLEKAYDKVGLPFVFTTLRKMGFDTPFCKWLVAMYTLSTSAVMINGHLSQSFKLTRSLRQGCPLAPLLFVLQMEVLLNRLRRNPNLRGLTLHSGTQCKVKAFADNLSSSARTRAPH
ncbi:hypothetical protein CBR_g78 [Chara braunii]|uniref:Reverse transcriptase domain-containing protein n=1 Tax=Chara braunii TaxID=69332 RepID=A0A388JLJ1_CHABU|nr:hypothetical protein CBR_g78 [Chara braunii]|eukprot:GBG58677.1 hypothetical protein CBR_g78 [Chara braunii]